MILSNTNQALSDSELAEIWLKGQDLNGKTPEEVKEMYFDAWHRIHRKNVERWD